MREPIIRTRGLRREFSAGDEKVAVLKGIDLDIYEGEMIAIIGQSGSGKSTLMNVLGCLDRGWTGEYAFAGRDVAKLGANDLATLRRNHFGFIFQRYQLLPDLNATENVEVPAVYSGAHPAERRKRAQELLDRLGLSERLTYRPTQLSGGQQQRVSVARALVNGGDVILADEPTGALDSKSGLDLIALLSELHAEGHTVIIVTHDPAIAAKVQRTIEIKDGEIVADSISDTVPAVATATREARTLRRVGKLREWVEQSVEALRTAFRAMWSHKLRTFLTMLGIIIGISSVVMVVALGQGTQATVLENISSLGSNTINIYPGAGFADRRSGAIRTLIAADAAALAIQPYADSVTPQVSANASARYRSVSANAAITGVGEQYFRVNNKVFVSGVAFDQDGVTMRTQEAVIDERARTTFFPGGEDPIGKVILLGNVPVRIIGVVETASSFGPGGNSLNVWVPFTTAMTRILGQSYLGSITVRVADSADMADAEARIKALMLSRHGLLDFQLQNTDTIRQTIESTAQTLTLLISAIAVISLVVGGIGVMNIMLVSVSERTREIGVRMAVGARQSDILRQFLTESVLVCLVGGMIGVVLAVGAGTIITTFVSTIRLSYSPFTVLAAFASSTLIGIVFGFMPARSAARLDPVVALARE